MIEKKIRFELTLDSLKFLTKIVKNKTLLEKINDATSNKIYKNLYFTQRYFLELTRKEIEMILDELTADSEKIGIYENSVVVGLGSDIEGLIDIFSNEYYNGESSEQI